MTTCRAIKPVAAETALSFGQALFFFAFWALAVHLPMFDVVGKNQSALRAFSPPTLADFVTAALRGTDIEGLAATTKILAFLLFFTNRAFVHAETSSALQGGLLQC